MEYTNIIISIVLALLASSGFWSYRIKKLERKYQQEDKSRDIDAKLSQLIKSQEMLVKKIDLLTEAQEKSNAVTMAVARDRIYHLCKKSIEERRFDPDSMRDIKGLMTPYKDNDGDGIADEYFERYEHLYKTNTEVMY